VTGDLVQGWGWTLADTVAFVLTVTLHVTVLVLLASGGGC